MKYDHANIQCNWCQSFSVSPDMCHHPDNIYRPHSARPIFRECVYNRMDYFTPDTKIFPCQFFEGTIDFYKGRNIVGRLVSAQSNSLLQFQSFEKS